MSNNNGLLSSTDVSATGDPQSNFFIRKREPLIVDIIIANEVITDEINLNTGILTTTGGGTILTLNGVPTGGGELDTLTAIAPLVITGTAADEIIAIAPSGVVAGTYTVSEITVNALGLITSAASGVVPPNDDWSAFPAQSNVNLNGFAIQNLQTPTNPQDGSTKGYTDALDAQNVKLTGAQSIGDVKNFLLPPTTNILPTTNNQLCNKLYVDSVLPGADPLSVVLTTGNSAGGNQIDMSSNKIVNLLNPTAAQDAATKNYVDNLPPPAIPSLSQVLSAGNTASADINMSGFDISAVNDITMSGLLPTITATNILGNLVISSAATMALTTGGIMSILAGANLSIGSAGSTTVEDVRFTNNIITSTGNGLEINSVAILTSADGTKNLDFSNPKLFLSNQGSSVVIQNLDVSTTNTGATLVQTVNNTNINILGVKNISENSASPGITVTASSAIALTAPTITAPLLTGTSGITNVLTFDTGSKAINFQPITAPTLANVLSTGNTSGNNDILMSFGKNLDARDGEVFAGQINISQIGPLFPGLADEIGFTGSLAFPGPIELRNNAQNAGVGLKINAIPLGSSTNVLGYDANTHQITYKASDIIPPRAELVYQPVDGKTVLKTTLNYAEDTTIKTSDVVPSIDGWATEEQVYTFGQSKPNRMVGVGSITGGNNIIYSNDGLVWTGITGQTIFSSANGVAWNGSIYVAVGSGNNTIAYSHDGIVWVGLGNIMFSTAARAVAWGGDRFIASGQGATNTLAYSFDGIIWIGLGRTVFGVNGRGVGYNGLRWVVVGDGGNTIAYSNDGLTFIGVGTSIFSATGFGISWNGLLWVAGGQGVNTLATSPDGITWTARGQTIFTGSCREIEWNGNVFVGVGDGTNSLGYSFNGINWIGLGLLIFNASARSIVWNGTRFIAGGASSNNSIAHSRDGIVWTGLGMSNITNCFGLTSNARNYNTIKIPTNVTLALGEESAGTPGSSSIGISTDNGLTFAAVGGSVFTDGYSAAWSGTRWVAVGQGTNTIATSTNGVVWTGLGLSIFNQIGLGVVWNGKIFVAVGNGTNSIATSEDGITWVGRGELIFGSGIGVTWNGKIFVAVGQGDNTIATSTNGIDWIGRGTSVFSGAGLKVAWNGSIFVAVGFGTNTIAYSNDGVNWTGIGTSVFSQTGKGVAWNGSRWVAVGLGANSIAFSSNGINWTGVTGKSIFSDIANGIVWNGVQWIAVGNGTNNVARSPDGVVWTGLGPSVFASYANDAVWNYGLAGVDIQQPTIAMGLGSNTIAYSSDGINFRGITGTSIFAIGLGVVWNGKRYIGFGQGDNSIAYSNNGIDWIGLGNNVFDIGFSAVWSGDKWIAVGEGANTLATSLDGITWTVAGNDVFSVRGSAVAFNGKRYVAVGQGQSNSIAYSDDGQIWIGIGSSIFDAGLAVTWVGDKFVAVGSGANSIAYSTDGESWTGIGTSIFINGRGLAWDGNRIVAVGNGSNTIASSIDGITWTGQGTSILSVNGSGVAWNSKRFIALGEGGNTIAISTNGLNWRGFGSSIFSEGYATAGNPQVGAVIVDSQIVLNEYSVGQSNKLDVVSDVYFNTGYSGLALSITSR